MKRVCGILIIAGLLAAVAGSIPLHALEVRESGGAGKAVFLKRVTPGDTFALSFIHSVEKSEVTDYFRIDDDYRIILYRTEFGSLNTGLPAVVSEGEIFERTDRGFRISNLNRVLPEIQLWVHEDHGGSLAVGGKIISLPALAGNGLLRISLQRVPAWELLPWAFGI
jgi:hypothetical protein